MRIADYGLIGHPHTAPSLGPDAAAAWRCLPRCAPPSCFAALLGDETHGQWRIAPAGEAQAISRRYRPGTLVLETEFETPTGTVRLVDFMPRRSDGPPRLMRIVEGISGRVPMQMTLALRPDYASISPWLEVAPDGVIATAGPD